MRVSAKYNSNPSSCETNFDGEVEDYSLNILALSAPEINIQGNSINITDGDLTPTLTDFTDFGNVDIASGTNPNTFTIQNLGTLPLTVTGVNITGTHASDFTLTTSPSASIAASSNTTFTITFNPSALGLRTATISIPNNDSNENPYVFNVQGTGTTVRAPGGVNADLKLWLKSTAGLSYTNGQSVSLWQDQGYAAANATVPAVGLEPKYYDNATKNVNFNPVIDFDNNYNTATEDYGYSDTTRNTLVGASGLYTQDMFVVAIPDITVNSATASMDVFCGDKNFGTNERDGTGIGYGKYSVRFDNELISYAVGTSPNSPSTPVSSRGYGVAHTSTSASYNNVGIINSKNNSTSPTANILLYNANNIGNTEVGLPQFSNVSNSRYFLGRSEAYKGSYDGRICEVITYSAKKTDANLTQERNRIQSYLAIKYGITLGINGTSQDYVDSSGSVIWNQTANSGFNYNITGIGRDDLSDLNQKQSKSVNNATDGIGPIEGIVTIGLSNIYDTNNLNTNTFPSDKQFLVWGDNGADLNLAATTVSVNMSAGISGLHTDVTFTAMQRVWKVVETGGDIPSCKVRIPQNAIRNINPPGSYLMFISDTGVFDPTADYRVMTLDLNGNLNADYDFDGTKYITFGYAPQVIVERSVYFDGVQDYIDMENNLNLNPAQFTISAWIKRDTGTTNASILSKRNATYTEGYDFKLNATGRLEFVVNGGAASVTSSVVIPANKWHEVAV
ncbi:MAG: choice-of-anchor D domain-containing protein, partial [Confluentibacter sp.]|nr:choice-of-anchor D domain-containing protein [Confluentibacter sp.]